MAEPQQRTASRAPLALRVCAVTSIVFGVWLSLLAFLESYSRAFTVSKFTVSFAMGVLLVAVAYRLIYRNLTANTTGAKLAAAALAGMWSYAMVLTSGFVLDAFAAFTLTVEAINLGCLLYIFAALPWSPATLRVPRHRLLIGGGLIVIFAAAAMWVLDLSLRPSNELFVLTQGRERSLKPKDVFQECARCPEMVVVPAGSFTMGSPAAELARSSTEGPQHLVSFASPFAVGRFEVTFDQWEACVADGRCRGHVPSDGDWGREERPVINVSWNDAKYYLGWLSDKTGKTYRLLTEAEWEYVARAGTATPFWWGGSISTNQANYDGDHVYGGGETGEDRKRTLPVRSFEPNPWGLFQVHGNVAEHVEDRFNDTYVNAPADGSAWENRETLVRVVRGGDWSSKPEELRSASRGAQRIFFKFDETRFPQVGFRVARTLALPEPP